jgi:hypothetical protein
MDIGIDQDKYVVYEGRIDWGGRPLLPAPYLFGIQLAGTPDEATDLLKQSTDYNRLLFREDGFDPVSMVRRGRIYEPGQSYSTACRVYPINEAERNEGTTGSGLVVRHLRCYHRYPLSSRLGSEQLFAAIGSNGSYSMWRIVSTDRTCFDEELVTMRPLYFLGAIPDLSPESIPEQWRAKVQETVGKVVDSMHRANADSIIELCRHAASAALFAHFHEGVVELNKTDLRPLANRAEEEGLRLVGSCGKTIADLHSRIKPNMQMQYGLNSIGDRDAELAVHCLSLILRHLGYTRSP